MEESNIVPTIIFGIIFMAVLTVCIYVNVKCWNIPIAERSGMCALLH